MEEELPGKGEEQAAALRQQRAAVSRVESDVGGCCRWWQEVDHVSPDGP